MSDPVSVVVPTLADRELLAGCLAAVEAEVARRGAGDELLVVDDSGSSDAGAGGVREWLAREHPAARYHANERNLGFARALAAGVERARHPRVLALNPDVILRPGCLDPLVETLALDGVVAVAPYVLLDGEAGSAEALPRVDFEEGFACIRREPLAITPGRASAEHPEGVPVDFVLGGCFLFRREDFLARPFDPRFEPFYWEDVDWCRGAFEAGGRLLVDPRAVAEHHHRGTIGGRVPEELVRAAIEKNRLLFTWKHLREPEARARHFEALGERAAMAALEESREELLWLALALEQEGELKDTP